MSPASPPISPPASVARCNSRSSRDVPPTLEPLAPARRARAIELKALRDPASMDRLCTLSVKHPVLRPSAVASRPAVLGRWCCMWSLKHASRALRWLIAGVACGVAGELAAQALPDPTPPPVSVAPIPKKAAPIELAAVEVQAKADDKGYDASGMGSYEHQLKDSPFSN